MSSAIRAEVMTHVRRGTVHKVVLDALVPLWPTEAKYGKPTAEMQGHVWQGQVEQLCYKGKSFQFLLTYKGQRYSQTDLSQLWLEEYQATLNVAQGTRHPNVWRDIWIKTCSQVWVPLDILIPIPVKQLQVDALVNWLQCVRAVDVQPVLVPVNKMGYVRISYALQHQELLGALVPHAGAPPVILNVDIPTTLSFRSAPYKRGFKRKRVYRSTKDLLVSPRKEKQDVVVQQESILSTAVDLRDELWDAAWWEQLTINTVDTESFLSLLDETSRPVK